MSYFYHKIQLKNCTLSYHKTVIRSTAPTIRPHLW